MSFALRRLDIFRPAGHFQRVEELSGRKLRDIKARAQLLKPTVFVGKQGISDALIKSLDEALACHELVKVKFAAFKEQKKELSPTLAGKVSAQLVMRVGNVAVYFRAKPQAETAPVSPATQ